jgi:hypothetical protein
MSHVENCKVKVMDLTALKAACKRMGVEFVENKRTYNWYGRSVGDYPLPAGFKAEDLGKCDHVIRVPGVGYEVGVVKSKNGKGFDLLYDFWGPGQGLLTKFGQGLTKLADAYSVEALKAKALAQGYISNEVVADNGEITLTVSGF